MELEQYMEQVYDHLKWYERKAIMARQRHVLLDMLYLVFLLATPLVLMTSYLIIESRFGIMVGIATSLGAFFFFSLQRVYRFDSKWQQYRLTAEQLRKELAMFTMSAGEYGQTDDPQKRRDLFIMKIEDLVSREHSIWWVGESKEGSNVQH